MTTARDLIYAFVNKRGDDMARFGPPTPYRKMIEAGSDDDLYLHGLLNKVEDDRAHADAEKLSALGHAYKEAAKSEQAAGLQALGLFAGQSLIDAAKEMDPYEMRDGKLVRKSDGKPVII